MKKASSTLLLFFFMVSWVRDSQSTGITGFFLPMKEKVSWFFMGRKENFMGRAGLIKNSLPMKLSN